MRRLAITAVAFLVVAIVIFLIPVKKRTSIIALVPATAAASEFADTDKRSVAPHTVQSTESTLPMQDANTPVKKRPNVIEFDTASAANAAKGGPLFWSAYHPQHVLVIEGGFFVDARDPNGTTYGGSVWRGCQGSMRSKLRVSLSRGILEVDRNTWSGLSLLPDTAGRMRAPFSGDAFRLRPLLEKASFEPGEVYVLARLDVLKGGVVIGSDYYYIFPLGRGRTEPDEEKLTVVKNACFEDWRNAALGKFPDTDKRSFAPYEVASTDALLLAPYVEAHDAGK
jgi:hypothetical protein